MAGMIEVADWEHLLLAYLINPIDKSIEVQGHEARAARYASRALGRGVVCSELEAIAQQINAASAFEQIPMPLAGVDRICRSAGLEIRHPICGDRAELTGLLLKQEIVENVIGAIVSGLSDPRMRFLSIWRLLPNKLADCLGPYYPLLPADARIPDHSLIHQADVRSGMVASRRDGHGGAYLSLSLGPVQGFIAAARTVRDLWSGSAILSWLTFQGLRPILEALGPTAVVYPALRGNSLMDLWLRREVGLEHVPEPCNVARRSPSIPNRFIALVPRGMGGAAASAMAEACAESVRENWVKLSSEVQGRLDPAFKDIDPEWSRRWRTQIDSFLEIRTTVLPQTTMNDSALAGLVGGTDRFGDAWPDAQSVRALADAIPLHDRPEQDQQSSGRWQANLEVLARLGEAQRAIRHVPEVPAIPAPTPPKCSLLGSYEQMGPDTLENSRRFWEAAGRTVQMEGVRLRPRERFSAIALTKRFAAPAKLAEELDLRPADLRFPDTATVAAAAWLLDAGIDPEIIRRQHGTWNGRWIHPHHRHGGGADDASPAPEVVRRKIEMAREVTRPPVYYAILMLDADNIGEWLRGGCAPSVRDILHPDLLTYYEGLGQASAAGLKARRPVQSVHHASISEALNSFASHVAPGLVSKHSGTMIYSGGDDVLALLPARCAVPCAIALRKAFLGLDRTDPDVPAGWSTIGGHPYLTMGSRATVSAGIVFVHFMDDLRLALDAAREAEASAKRAGRDTLALGFLRRSGERGRAVLPSWDLADWFRDLVALFAQGVTDRWAYRLRAELPTLGGAAVPREAVASEIRRLVDRTSEGTLSGHDAEAWWRNYSCEVKRQNRSSTDMLFDFTQFCQGASFVARGDDG